MGKRYFFLQKKDEIYIKCQKGYWLTFWTTNFFSYTILLRLKHLIMSLSIWSLSLLFNRLPMGFLFLYKILEQIRIVTVLYMSVRYFFFLNTMVFNFFAKKIFVLLSFDTYATLTSFFKKKRYQNPASYSTNNLNLNNFHIPKCFLPQNVSHFIFL